MREQPMCMGREPAPIAQALGNAPNDARWPLGMADANGSNTHGEVDRALERMSRLVSLKNKKGHS
jgi:hypothetical protein